jgi:hypothetical protein
MRSALVALGLAVLAGAAHAQETNEAKRDKKLKEPFLSKAAWTTDYDKAREEARKSGKLIFVYFTRSYAT